METPSLADELPAIYRSILDAVAELERVAQRREAALIRAAAIAAYSGAWDERGRRRLEGLARRAGRVLDGTDRPREAPTGLRRVHGGPAPSR